MSHRDAPPETASQIACREFWQRAQPHVTRAWGRAKDGSFLAEESQLLHKAWMAAQAGKCCAYAGTYGCKCNTFQAAAEPVAQFVETYWNRHANGEVSFVRLPIAEFPEWVLESDTYDVFRNPSGAANPPRSETL